MVWQASVNPKAETVEELLARRKDLHMGMVKLAREDLNYILHAGIDSYTVPNCAAARKNLPPPPYCLRRPSSLSPLPLVGAAGGPNNKRRPTRSALPICPHHPAGFAQARL